MRFKVLLYHFWLVLIPCIGVSQNTFIPDDNFEQALIDLGFDGGPLDDFVPTANISSINELIIPSLDISDLTGIEDFTALSILDCSDNLLTTVNISSNTSLTQLFVQNNQIATLNVSTLSDLLILWCFENDLNSIDVSRNLKLISLVCNNNNLTDLNTTNNVSLNVLVCNDNLILDIDVSDNIGLSRFECGNNLLSTLDLSNNLNLSNLSCEENQLTNLNLNSNSLLNSIFCYGNQLTDLDLSQNSSLRNLDCSSNNLCSLDLSNGNNNNITSLNFEFNTNLNCVVVDNINGNRDVWLPASFSNYVDSIDDCSNFIPVDSLNNFVGVTFTLPVINNGSYFTESAGNGTTLNSGDIISTSQTIYIYNQTTCGSNESSFSILITDRDYYIPKYFTPNNDGTNDYWKVFESNSNMVNISIFDKYGKLLKSLSPDSEGWDGMFNGQLMQTDDYWYLISFSSGEVVTGHFALKR